MTYQTVIRSKGTLLWRIALCAAVCLFPAGCGGPDQASLDRLYGTWTTDDPKYDNAWFQILPEKIIFYTVEETVNLNVITNIEQTRDRDGKLFVIEYEDRQGQEYVLTFFLYRRPIGDILVFKHQKEIIWKKKDGN